MNKHEKQIAKALIASELVTIVLRDDQDFRHNSLSEWVACEMITDYVLPNVPEDVEDKKQYVKEVFNLFKQEVLNRIQNWEPDWVTLFFDE